MVLFVVLRSKKIYLAENTIDKTQISMDRFNVFACDDRIRYSLNLHSSMDRFKVRRIPPAEIL